jgi:hypothetical protein
MKNSDIQIINSIDEIVQCDVKYAHKSKPRKYICIDKDGEKEYCIFGYICGDQPTAATENANRVKYWKTFNGVKRALKKYSQTGEWGMRHWNDLNK